MKHLIALGFLIILGQVIMISPGESQEPPLKPEIENEYKILALEADRLAQKRNFSGAIAAIQKLIDNKQLPITDRVMMTLNKAILLGMDGKPAKALDTYDKAIAFEIPIITSYIQERKAAYLHELGRFAESLDIYKSLLDSKDIKEEDRQRFESNITIIEQILNPDSALETKAL